jgi:hypothetical protein
MSQHFRLKHESVEELVNEQKILVYISGAIAAMMLLPGLYTIRKAAQAELKPIIFMAAMILVYSFSWMAI